MGKIFDMVSRLALMAIFLGTVLGVSYVLGYVISLILNAMGIR